MTNVPIHNLTDTWSDSGTEFTSIRMNVTDTASASGSKLMDLLLGGVSQLALTKAGDLTLAGSITAVGGNLTGTVSGNATLSGDVTLSGSPAFTGSPDFSSASNKSAIRTALGLEIGSDVQAWDADLDAYAGNPLAAAELDQLQNINSTTISAAQWGYLGSASAFGGSLIDDADAATARTTLGLGSGDAPTFVRVSGTGTPTDAAHLTRKDYVDAAVAAIITADFTVNTASDAAALAATITDGQRIQTMARTTLGDGGGALWELDATLGDVTGDATITAGTYTPTEHTFDPSTAVNTTTDVITITGHGLSAGERVWYEHGGGTAIGGLTSSNLYWARDVTTNTFKLAATPAGAAIDLTSAGAGAAHTVQSAAGAGRVSLVDVTDSGGSGTGAKAYVVQSWGFSSGIQGQIIDAWMDPENPGSGYSGTPTADLSGITDLSGASVTFALADNGSRIAVSGTVRRLKNVTDVGYVDAAFGCDEAAADNTPAILRMLRAGERDGRPVISTLDLKTKLPLWTRGGFEWRAEKGSRIWNNESGGRFPNWQTVAVGMWTAAGIALNETEAGYSNTPRHNISTIADDRVTLTTTTAGDAGNYTAGEMVFIISRQGSSNNAQFLPFFLAVSEVESVNAGTGLVKLKEPITGDPGSYTFDIISAEIAEYADPTAPIGADSGLPYFGMKDLRMTGFHNLRSSNGVSIGGSGGNKNCVFEIDRIQGRHGIFGNAMAFGDWRINSIYANGKAFEQAVGSHDNKARIGLFVHDPDASDTAVSNPPTIHGSENCRNLDVEIGVLDCSAKTTTDTRIMLMPYLRDSRFVVNTLRCAAFTGNIIDFTHNNITGSTGTAVGRPTVNNTVIIRSCDVSNPNYLIRLQNSSASGDARVDLNNVSIHAPNITSSPGNIIALNNAYDNVIFDSYIPFGPLIRTVGDETMRVINSYWNRAALMSSAELDDISLIGVQATAEGLDWLNVQQVYAKDVESDTGTITTFDATTGNINTLNSTVNAVLTGGLNIGSVTGGTLTVASGAVTRTRMRHRVDTEAGAATDDLDTISGGADGDLILLSAVSTVRTVVLKDGTGNLRLSGDFSLDNIQDTILLMYDGALAFWLELSRSDNNT